MAAYPHAVLMGQVELPKKFLGGGYSLRGAVDFENGIPGGDFDPQGLLCFTQKRLIGVVELGKGVGVFEGEGFGAQGASCL
jgi:hypothetical protein